jgi:glutathione peroxidase
LVFLKPKSFQSALRTNGFSRHRSKTFDISLPSNFSGIFILEIPMWRFLFSMVLGWFVFSSPAVSQDAQTDPSTPQESESNKDGNANSEVPKTLNFKMKSIDGEEIDLAQYAGKVVVIVNTASRCGMTPQYKGLQELHEKYNDKDVVILGFPCNQFGGQEPGSEDDIKTFCEKNYGVEFDMFSKVDVNGKNAAELFKLLKSIDAKPAGTGDVRWNFEKFILDKSGNLVARFGSRVNPTSKEFVEKLESVLSN